MDPSKNFLHFRQQLRDSKPPVIPFFPLVKKDFQFIDLANQTFLSCDDSKQELINWEKMRLLGIKCRELQQMTAPSQHQPTTPTNRETTLSSSVAKEAFNQLKALNDSKENNYKKIWEKQRMRKRVQWVVRPSRPPLTPIWLYFQTLFGENLFWDYLRRKPIVWEVFGMRTTASTTGAVR